MPPMIEVLLSLLATPSFSTAHPKKNEVQFGSPSREGAWVFQMGGNRNQGFISISGTDLLLVPTICVRVM